MREIKERPEYKNLTFFEPSDIIEMLKDGKMIYEPTSSLKDIKSSKKILAVTFFGDFFIYLVNEFNALPTKFVVINANQNEKLIPIEYIGILKNRIPEISNLNHYTDFLKSDGTNRSHLNVLGH